jgi:DNA modification methylase
MASPRPIPPPDLQSFLPDGLGNLDDPQKAIPRIAKTERLTTAIAQILPQIPTVHQLYFGDARQLTLPDESIHLVLTSPTYWTLKEHNPTAGQPGHVEEYELFLNELDKVWQRCFAALVPGGRLICIVGDVSLTRRQNAGRHMVLPLHASIQERCRAIGFDNLAPIVWHKVANAAPEAEVGGLPFLGKPYEPNEIIKNDIEFILMERKPGGYRTPDLPTRILSVIPESCHREWFHQIWAGIRGASPRHHPAEYPFELATRLIRMFSFVGDTILDPFLGTGTTSFSAAECGRNSIGCETDQDFMTLAHNKIMKHASSLFNRSSVTVHR